MSGFSWSIPAFPSANQGVSVEDANKQFNALFGHDIWLDLASGALQRQVKHDGDWLLVDGIEALRQAIIRRIITNPGEWTTLPDYGVGVRNYVKQKNTRANRDALAARIKDQISQDPRVAEVQDVVVESSEGSMKITVNVTPKARTSSNGVGVTLEIS